MVVVKQMVQNITATFKNLQHPTTRSKKQGEGSGKENKVKEKRQRTLHENGQG